MKVGRDAIRQAFKDFAAAKPRLRSNIVMHAAQRRQPRRALQRLDDVGAHAGRTSPIEMTGKAIEVVCRQSDGTWKFAVDDPFAAQA